MREQSIEKEQPTYKEIIEKFEGIEGEILKVKKEINSDEIWLKLTKPIDLIVFFALIYQMISMFWLPEYSLFQREGLTPIESTIILGIFNIICWSIRAGCQFKLSFNEFRLENLEFQKKNGAIR